MIRRAFMRRMAHAALAGMLGAELTWRAPAVHRNLPDDMLVATYPQWQPSRVPSPPLTEKMLMEMIERIRQRRHEVPRLWLKP